MFFELPCLPNYPACMFPIIVSSVPSKVPSQLGYSFPFLYGGTACFNNMLPLSILLGITLVLYLLDAACFAANS